MNPKSCLSALVLAACAAHASGAVISTTQRVAASTKTAQTNPNCAKSVLGDYYWEIGSAAGVLASGTVGTTVASTTPMSLDSASKWIYASYVVQTYNGTVPAAQVPYLNFTSGYSNFGSSGRCAQTDTPASCLAHNNGAQNPDTIGYFYYDNAHMQVHAVNFAGLGSDTTTLLNDAIVTPMFNLTGATSLGYSAPLMGGGVYASGSSYGAFLRRMLSGTLAMKRALGSYKVCTNPGTCPTAKYSPIQQAGESWSYSLGHWVEDDPVVGDGAFSSAGLGGFYPWIDKTKSFYGVIARNVVSDGTFEGYVSAQCGRMIRQAFTTGIPTTSTVPTPRH